MERRGQPAREHQSHLSIVKNKVYGERRNENRSGSCRSEGLCLLRGLWSTTGFAQRSHGGRWGGGGDKIWVKEGKDKAAKKPRRRRRNRRGRSKRRIIIRKRRTRRKMRTRKMTRTRTRTAKPRKTGTRRTTITTWTQRPPVFSGQQSFSTSVKVLSVLIRNTKRKQTRLDSLGLLASEK